jgi:hypothetical protein
MTNGDTIVTMIYFCGHWETKPLKEFGKLHSSVRILDDGTCNRLKWCPECTEKRMKHDPSGVS